MPHLASRHCHTPETPILFRRTQENGDNLWPVRTGAVNLTGDTPLLKYRSLFISDLHLGIRSCQADALLDFLRHTEADTLYLVGDIVDFWKVRRGPHWPQSHNDVVQKLLRKSRKGTRVVYIPGNHDEGLRDYCGMNFGDVEVLRDCVHEAANGKKYLVLHGDEFDIVVCYARWLALLGDVSYEFALSLNTPLNWVRRQFGLGYWSLSAFLKNRVKHAVNFIGEFETALSKEADRRGVSGMICGHIHHANERWIGSIHYLNSGDWVESCTAIAEHDDGRFEIIHWRDVMAQRQVTSRTDASVRSELIEQAA
jgi:UDP-2,3-diacylglucosamine pyrophosphatase LpxH